MSGEAVPAVTPGRARYALGVLFTINLFNYIDRQVISGVLPLVQQDLRLSDTALGWLASAFMILYLAGSIPLGVLGDRVARNRLIAVGVGMWGVATFLSGLARSYGQLFTARALVGIGEASYGPTASAMVSDLFPRERRGFVNALFNAAIPLGGAIGVMAGGLVGSRYGWRAAFMLVALPSIALTLLAWRLGDPPRGAHDSLPVADRSRRDPVADPGRGEAIPGKVLARILLAGGCHVGMGEHARRGDGRAGEDVGAQPDHGGDLPVRIGRQAAVMARMDDLDADRARIDVGDPGPGAAPGMPRPLGLRHQLGHAPVLEHEVMGRDFRGRVAQARERALRRRHAGIVQDQHVGG